MEVETLDTLEKPARMSRMSEDYYSFRIKELERENESLKKEVKKRGRIIAVILGWKSYGYGGKEIFSPKSHIASTLSQKQDEALLIDSAIKDIKVVPVHYTQLHNKGLITSYILKNKNIENVLLEDLIF